MLFKICFDPGYFTILTSVVYGPRKMNNRHNLPESSALDITNAKSVLWCNI